MIYKTFNSKLASREAEYSKNSKYATYTNKLQQ